jgi:hypothetical protein
MAPALRRGALAAVPVTGAAMAELQFGPGFAGAVSAGALVAGFVAFDAPARIRWRWQAIAAPAIGVAAAVGVLSSQSPYLAVVAITLAGCGGGLAVAISPRHSLAAVCVVLALLIAQGLDLASGDARAALLLAGAGALLQAIFALGATAFDSDTEPFGLSRGARSARAAIAENLTLDSPVMRHALRWGMALGVATAFYRFVDLQGHGYWIPLTVLFVLKPGLDDTRERLGMRAAGTMAGLLLATLLAETMINEPVVVALALGASAAFAYALLMIEYALFTTAITVFVVLLTDSLGQDAIQVADERALATLLGILIAGVAFLALPERAPRPATAA